MAAPVGMNRLHHEIGHETGTKTLCYHKHLALAKLSDSTNFENVYYQKLYLKKFVYTQTNGCMQKHDARQMLFAE